MVIVGGSYNSSGSNYCRISILVAVVIIVRDRIARQLRYHYVSIARCYFNEVQILFYLFVDTIYLVVNCGCLFVSWIRKS